MTVPVLFALIGTVILVGFLANLLFRLTKIPSVLVLVAIGVVLGPVTGWLRHDALLTIAPFFGAVALLVILFEGGLELDVEHVVRHAPRTALFTAAVFAISMAAAAAVAHFAIGLPLSLALMLGAILGATSPAIVMPVVSGLSIRDDVKTVIKLESAMGEVLLIVSVVLLIDSHQAGTADAVSWVWGFARSLLVALLVATVAGVLWSRLVGWLGREPLSYMLTLGVTCLLYFAVEELGGSPAIAVLLFGLLLANMQFIAGRIGPHVRDLFGIDVKDDQFVLGQFMVNITAELSFLVRTFFFVYLGLLLDFSALSPSLAGWIGVMFVLLLVSRRLGVAIFRRSGARFSGGEWQAIMALQPRGLATAVVALLPLQAGIAAAADFPLFAFVVIVLSNLFMTGGILFAERRVRAEGLLAAAVGAPLPAGPAAGEPDVAAMPAGDPDTAALRRRPPLFSPARDFEDEPPPTNFSDWMARVSGLRLADREPAYIDLLRAAFLSEPLFWVQATLGAAICALGLILGQTTVVIGGALIVPAARVVLPTGLALASGDLYLLSKLAAKLVGFCLVTVTVSVALVGLVPFADALGGIVARTRPTILDFLVALFGGMSAAAVVARRQAAAIQYLPGAVVGLTLVPALCVVGFALTDALGPSVLKQATLQFSANLFASILGAGLVLLALGVHRAAQAPLVRQWKAEELARPVASAVFRRLGLEQAIGRTGSVRARAIVVGIFLLLLLTPLQLAFNQVQAELRTRQAVAAALRPFDVPNRSAILSSEVALAQNRVHVRVHVATSDPFSPDERADVERRILADTGRTARLELVQTVADVGDAVALRELLEDRRGAGTPAPPPTIRASLEDAEARLAVLLRSSPLPGGARIVGARASLAPTGPGLALEYLADRELDPDAQVLLVRLVAAQTQLAEQRVTLAWLPATRLLRLARGGIDGEADALLDELRSKGLPQRTDLVFTVGMAPGLPPATAAAVAARVQERLGLGQPPAVVPDAALDRRVAALRIAPSATGP